MNNERLLEQQLSQLPLLAYGFITPQELEFSPRIRHICKTECPMYNQTWACPPAVGTVDACRHRLLAFSRCLVIATVAEVDDIADIESTLATRPAHEEITNQVIGLFDQQEVSVYALSTEACALCERCAWLDGQSCRMPGKMHPCLESHGINIIPTLEALGIEFQYGGNIVTWVSLLFFQD